MHLNVFIDNIFFKFNVPVLVYPQKSKATLGSNHIVGDQILTISYILLVSNVIKGFLY